MSSYILHTNITSDPVSSFDQALERVAALKNHDSHLAQLNPVCGTNLLEHGAKVDRVILFLHGFTSCPDQFSQLGREFFERGFNVFIPRLPRHGIRDRLGEPLKGLTAEEMAEFAYRVVDIAQGLGERVIVAGLSGGGSITTWLSQVRADVDLAVPISPFLGVGFIPSRLNRLLTSLLLKGPDFFLWWDPVNKQNNPRSAPYSYTRYPIHALFENLRLGYIAGDDAKITKPAAGSILMITNANDIAVNNGVIAEYEAIWKRYGDNFLASYQFPKELGLPHDLITVGRPDSNIEVVYPKLHELIN